MAAHDEADRPATSGAASSPPGSPRLAPRAPNPEALAGAISDASLRLRALAALSGSLTDPLTPEEAADVVERQALAILGASSAVVVTHGSFPRIDHVEESLPGAPAAAPDTADATDITLTLVHAIGLPADVEAALQRVPLDAPVPLAEVARTGEPIFLHSEDELRGYPGWGDSLVRAGSRAAAAVPVWANGQLRGVLGLTWAMPRAFDEDERAFVVTLGVMCAQAIMRGHLTTAERRAREAAEHANLAKTQFLRTVSHELRTPMSAVIGYTALLADEIVGPTNPVQKEHLRRMRGASGHLLALVEQLLGFARLDAGEEVVRVEPVLAASVVEEAVNLVRPLAEVKGLRMRVELPDAPIELLTDRLKLRQILLNLLMNAVKYTDVGNVVLILRIEGLGAEVRIIFEVADSGRGISRADQEHIFESFWQADQTLTRRAEGTGLGLAVARQLARLLGGEVVVAKSELGRGSTFIASVPPRYRPMAANPRDVPPPDLIA